jgi:hypothetical protein
MLLNLAERTVVLPAWPHIIGLPAGGAVARIRELPGSA